MMSTARAKSDSCTCKPKRSLRRRSTMERNAWSSALRPGASRTSKYRSWMRPRGITMTGVAFEVFDHERAHCHRSQESDPQHALAYGRHELHG